MVVSITRGTCTIYAHSQDMQCASDPISIAIFYNTVMGLFFEHLMDVDSTQPKGWPDGVASKYFRGVLGSPVEAYHGAIETQGRGGLHAHMHVWLLHPLRAKVVDQLRSGRLTDDLVKRLTAWQLAVRQKVGSVQFDGIEEVGRQLGMEKSDVPPLPFSVHQQSRTCH